MELQMAVLLPLNASYQYGVLLNRQILAINSAAALTSTHDLV